MRRHSRPTSSLSISWVVLVRPMDIDGCQIQRENDLVDLASGSCVDLHPWQDSQVRRPISDAEHEGAQKHNEGYQTGNREDEID